MASRLTAGFLAAALLVAPARAETPEAAPAPDPEVAPAELRSVDAPRLIVVPVETWCDDCNRLPPEMRSQPVRPDAAGAGFVQARRLTPTNVPPYPPEALRDGLEGSVSCTLTICEHGVVRDAIPPAGAPTALVRAALRFWRGERFAPATLDGKPVATLVVGPVSFRLAE